MSVKKQKKQNVEHESTQHVELLQKLVNVNKTSKVVKGGRVFSFNALVVVGNGSGRVGFGLGKGKEVAVAIKKAVHAAKKNMVDIPLNNATLFHTIIGTHCATKVFMKPASEGTGVIAGGSMRAIFEVLGVENVLAKCYGSTNPLNVIRATMKGLESMFTPEIIAKKRGLSIKEASALIETE